MQAHKRMQRGQMARSGMGQEMNIMRNMHKRKTARRVDDRYYGNATSNHMHAALLHEEVPRAHDQFSP